MMQVDIDEETARNYQMIRSGKPINTITEKQYAKILEEVGKEPCDQCGIKTSEAGSLFAKYTTDNEGRNIVQMVCAKCLKNSKKRRTKA